MKTFAEKPVSFRAGLDVGSTTAKLVLLDHDGQPVFTEYRRHGSDIIKALSVLFEDAARRLGDRPVDLTVTGSAGMGIAESNQIPFVQEVVATGDVVRRHFTRVSTIIDIGGEDSKVMFLRPGCPPDIRMNGSCAGGTGAFIDQMAGLLNLSLEEMNGVADRYSQLYPIASRCGVFAKTDVQNLLSRKVDLPDICASIFHAVVMQLLTTLARGIAIRPTVFLCGGPLTFLSSLRSGFQRALGLAETDILLPPYSNFMPAWGAALAKTGACRVMSLRGWREQIRRRHTVCKSKTTDHRQPALFADDQAFRAWKLKRVILDVPAVNPENAVMPLFMGIDSGSTTTKLLALDAKGRVVFREYRPNRGNWWMPWQGRYGILKKNYTTWPFQKLPQRWRRVMGKI